MKNKRISPETAESIAIESAIRATIATLQITRQEFASLMGVGRSALYQWIRDPGQMQLRDYWRMREIFAKAHITVQQFLEV